MKLDQGKSRITGQVLDNFTKQHHVKAAIRIRQIVSLDIGVDKVAGIPFAILVARNDLLTNKGMLVAKEIGQIDLVTPIRLKRIKIIEFCVINKMLKLCRRSIIARNLLIVRAIFEILKHRRYLGIAETKWE
jgi:hypothetical protein